MHHTVVYTTFIYLFIHVLYTHRRTTHVCTDLIQDVCCLITSKNPSMTRTSPTLLLLLLSSRRCCCYHADTKYFFSYFLLCHSHSLHRFTLCLALQDWLRKQTIAMQSNSPRRTYLTGCTRLGLLRFDFHSRIAPPSTRLYTEKDKTLNCHSKCIGKGPEPVRNRGIRN